MAQEKRGRVVKIKDIYYMWSQKKGTNAKRILFVQKGVCDVMDICEEVKNEEKSALLEKVRLICVKLASKWKQSGRQKLRFFATNETWLNGVVTQKNIGSSSETPTTSTCQTRGRPKKIFEGSSERSKRRKALQVKTVVDQSQLIEATKKALKSEGSEDAAKLLNEATLTPTRAKKIINVWDLSQKSPTQAYTNDEALSLIIENNLTKQNYENLRYGARIKNCDLYPSYHNVLKAKKECYPPTESITISESLIEVNLQELLNLTVSRLLICQKEVLGSFSNYQLKNLTLISKWGFDGSTGHSEYKQVMTEEFSDADIFITSYVPLQMYFSSPNLTDKKILWQNPRPSSRRYCRPIRIQFKKESTELTNYEYNYIDNQIQNIKLTKIGNVSVKHKMAMTMVDGKVCNAVTATTSAQKCYICGATPKEMNNIDEVLQKEVDRSSFQFGLSTLHAWIRFFEYFLHISYRLDFMKWQARGTEDQAKLKERKRHIQEQFKKRMGLIVDKVKPGGSGTTNDGNTARRFFSNSALASEILNINEDLIKRCAILLQATASEFTINKDAFNKFALETARRLVDAYPWYNMPASVHKILVHGYLVIEEALLPIGQMSEEAQESRNKDLKSYRENFTRKISRIKTNQDLLNRLLVSSDPYITSLRRLPPKNKLPLYPEVLELLVAPCPLRRVSAESDKDDDNVSEDET